MDQLPESLLLEILNRLEDSADIASCRVALKAFNTVFPGLRWVNILCSDKWRMNLWSQPLKTVFVDLISKQETVEWVVIGHESSYLATLHSESHDSNMIDGDFAKEWLPKVSKSMKYLVIYGLQQRSLHSQSNVLSLISKFCRNLAYLKLKFAWLSMDLLNPMLMLTSLKLEFTRLTDELLSELNKCFTNLQVLKLLYVSGLKDPKIHLLNLKTCHWYAYDDLPSLTLIAPNLITLKIDCSTPGEIHVEAPMLSHFRLSIEDLAHPGVFTVKTSENLKTLLLDSPFIGSVLSEFPITRTVENLTLDSGMESPREPEELNLTLAKVFTVFPNVSSLHIKSGNWLELEACFDQEGEGWEDFDGGKGLKTICAYLRLVNPVLTLSYVAYVLDQCVGLSEVTLLIHDDVVGSSISKTFMSRCMARCPRLTWRWGIWGVDMED
ncbi:F-box/LRR-repeat protein At4g29420-like [Bidens hawaiensis]|uniref:F-box/LRR-repeat protein At4g29420-like n=1 Tax=Bidens hawaiensis TaxID=980011 RepID=UPI00404AFD2C